MALLSLLRRLLPHASWRASSKAWQATAHCATRARRWRAVGFGPGAIEGQSGADGIGGETQQSSLSCWRWSVLGTPPCSRTTRSIQSCIASERSCAAWALRAWWALLVTARPGQIFRDRLTGAVEKMRDQLQWCGLCRLGVWNPPGGGNLHMFTTCLFRG